MAHYYWHKHNENLEYEDYYVNCKIGKLGEEAVKRYLGKSISNVDYKLHNYGDGGTGFYLTRDKNIKLQVKTKSIFRYYQREFERLRDDLDYQYIIDRHFEESASKEIDKIHWSINQKEVNSNKISICILLLDPGMGNKINFKSNKYKFVMAGFKPTDMINNPKDIKIKMKDLFYSGRIRGYLESL